MIELIGMDLPFKKSYFVLTTDENGGKIVPENPCT